jgi:hypothetical protein
VLSSAYETYFYLLYVSFLRKHLLTSLPLGGLTGLWVITVEAIREANLDLEGGIPFFSIINKDGIEHEE